MDDRHGLRLPEKQFRIDPTRVEEYVHALGVVPTEGYEAIEGAAVPPGFLMYVTTYGSAEVNGRLGLDYSRLLYGGSDFEYHGEIRVGDTLTVAPHVSDVRTNPSRGLTFIELTCEYRLRDGTLAVTERSTTIQLERD